MVCAGIVRTPHDCRAQIHSSSRPSIREKNVCNRKNTGVTCAPIAAALCFNAAGTPRIPAESSDEIRLPHRQPVRHVALPSRCGRMRAVEGLRQSAPAARQRHTSRLIPFRRSVAPISEARERPRIPIRGFFFFASANTVHQHDFLNDSSGSLHRNARESFATRKASRCFFPGTRADSKRADPGQQVPKHPAANVRTTKSAHGSRSRGIHHEARKCCVAMLDAGGGSDPHDTDAYAHASQDQKHRRGTHMTIRATAHTGARP